MWFLAGLPGKLKVLVDRLTSTRAANLDNLNATVSSRAPASTALSNAVWSDARAAKLDSILLSGGSIKAIYRGYVNDSAATATVTIGGTVNTTKCIILIDGTQGTIGFSAAFGGYTIGSVRTPYVTALTTTTFSVAGRAITYRDGSSQSTAYADFGWQVIEFN